MPRLGYSLHYWPQPYSPHRFLDDDTFTLFAHYTAPPYKELRLTLATPTAQWLRYLRHHGRQPYSPSWYLDFDAFKLFAHYSAAAVQ